MEATRRLSMPFQIKRIYDARQPSDGKRVLVDRLWPRGVKKVDAHLDEWIKDVAPSTNLRTWFGHDPERFAEFRRRYKAELKGNTAVRDLRALGKRSKVTLLYAAHDPKVNHAIVLKSVLGRGTATAAPRKKAATKRRAK
jgi:uncharacterized protein YeaO (DUF488 family)